MSPQERTALTLGLFMTGTYTRISRAIKARTSGPFVAWHPTAHRCNTPIEALQTAMNGWIYRPCTHAVEAQHHCWKLEHQHPEGSLVCFADPGSPRTQPEQLQLPELRRLQDCVDCGVDTYQIDEYYIVYDQVWRAAGMDPERGRYPPGDDDDGMLCLECLSRRLGRRLYLDDFTMAPVNRKEHHRRAILRAVTTEG